MYFKKKQIVLFFLFLFLFLFSYSSYSFDNYFLMLKNNKVNVRYGPSFDYPIKYIYKKKYLPVEVIDEKDNFRRIIDHKKNSGWIHRSQLKDINSFIIMEEQILFSKPSKFSKPVALLSKGRLLLIRKCKKQWCQVKTDKIAGWVEVINVWGKS